MKAFRNHWPLVPAIALFLAILAGLVRSIMIRCDGQLVYVLDDPYIHMAVAKNYAAHGVWGVTKYGFTSSTSSIIWPLALAAIYKITGPNTVTPFVLNVIVAIGFLVLLYVLWRRYAVPRTICAVGLAAAVLLVPLSPIVLCAQEHILHCLLTVAVVYVASRLLCSKEGSSERRLSGILLLLLPVLTMTRYESFFLVGILCYLFALRGRMWYGFAVGIVATIPVVVYGAISRHMGWNWLPNPILVKGNTQWTSPKGMVLTLAYLERQLMQNPLMCLVLAGSAITVYVLWARRGSIWQEDTTAVGLLIPLVLMQVGLAHTGWFFRYEAYLVALTVFGFTLVWGRHAGSSAVRPEVGNGWGRCLACAFLFALVGLPMLDRAAHAHRQAPLASSEIYRQHCQMARFLGEYYDEQPVAANDIGAVVYFTDCRCLDLYGLGDIRVERAVKAGRYNSAVISELAKADGVKVAIVYDSWFTRFGGVPREWIRIGQWQINSTVVCGSPELSIYAVDPGEADNLAQNLADFASRLPSGVAQTGAYTELLR